MFERTETQQVEYIRPEPDYPAPVDKNPHHLATRGIAQTIGLQPLVAFTVVAVDLMVHTADVISAGMLLPFSAAVGVAVGVITFLSQRKWYGDDKEAAVIKALIVGLLTAIPSPLPYPLFISAGIAGLFRRKR
jgi:predicted Na+-dependent transporter